jgi:type IV pilus assembly protein PilX
MFNSFRQRQQGAILVVSLLLLLVMTVLALSASNATRMQERMAGNTRDLDLAFQGAEAGLRQAERNVGTELKKTGMRMVPLCADPKEPCVVDRPASALNYQKLNKDWWKANARPYGDPSVKEFDALADEPIARSELWTTVGDSLSDGGRPGQTKVAYFVNTSRAVGGTTSAEVVVQSVVAAPFVE